MEKEVIGKTLGYAARNSGFSHKGYRVYLLRGEDDRNGALIGSEYELTRIVREHKGLNRSRIVSHEEYYGIQIFRVREAGGDG